MRELVRQFLNMPTSVKVFGLVLLLIFLCCCSWIVLLLVILVVAYPLVLVPIIGIGIMAVIGAFSVKRPGIFDTNNVDRDDE